MKKSERLSLALNAFSTLPAAINATEAMQQLSKELEKIETAYSGLPNYSVTHGYAGNQLHLFAYSPSSPFWKAKATGELICQLTSHYAVFEENGSVTIYTRQGNLGGQMIFSKPPIAAPLTNVLLWG